MGNLIDKIKDIAYVIRNFGAVLSNIFSSLLTYVFMAIYYIFLAVCQLILLVEVVFKKLAGTAPVTVDGKFTDNIVMGFIFSDAVMRVFISMLVLAVVLLFVFTFIAIIKSEFALDAKGSAKGPIIGRAFKSLAYFIAVPVISVFGIFLTQGLTVGLDSLFAGKDTSQDAVGGMYGRVFYAAAYNSNRARTSNKFNSQINSGWNNDGGNFNASGNLSSAYKIDQAFLSERAMVESTVPTSGSFVNYLGDTVNYSDIETKSKGDLMCHVKVSERISKGLDSHIVFADYPDATNDSVHYTPLNAAVVNYYYDLVKFDYFIGIGGALVLAYFLLVTCFALMKRVFDIVVLMLIAPPMIALGPLDNGDATKKWTKEMVSRVVSVLASVFAMNMFFVIVPIFASVKIFGADTITSAVGVSIASGVSVASQTGLALVLIPPTIIVAMDAIFQLMIVLVGASVVKDTSALVSNLLGVKDLIKEGGDAAKKATETALKVGTAIATGGASLATLAKAGGRKKSLDEGKERAGAEAAASLDTKGMTAGQARKARRQASKDAMEKYKKDHEDDYKDATKQRNSGFAMMPGQLGKFGELFGKKAKLVKDADPDKEYKDVLKGEKLKAKAAADMKKEEDTQAGRELSSKTSQLVSTEAGSDSSALNTVLTAAKIGAQSGFKGKNKATKEDIAAAKKEYDDALQEQEKNDRLLRRGSSSAKRGAEAEKLAKTVEKKKKNYEEMAKRGKAQVDLQTIATIEVMMKQGNTEEEVMSKAKELSSSQANKAFIDELKRTFEAKGGVAQAEAQKIAHAVAILESNVRKYNSGEELTAEIKKIIESASGVLAGVKQYEQLVKDATAVANSIPDKK